jgi:hypothetical protein
MQSVAETVRPQEDWWQLLQRLRARRDAAGYPFLDEQRMAEHLDWLQEDDDRIEHLSREMEQDRRQEWP